MRRTLLSIGIVSLTLSASIITPLSAASAHRRHHYRGQSQTYQTCRHSSGTTGLIAGGVGGALVGNSILGHGVLGTIGGAAGGALAGRAIDRTITAKKRGCA